MRIEIVNDIRGRIVEELPYSWDKLSNHILFLLCPEIFTEEYEGRDIIWRGVLDGNRNWHVR